LLLYFFLTFFHYYLPVSNYIIHKVSYTYKDLPLRHLWFK